MGQKEKYSEEAYEKLKQEKRDYRREQYQLKVLRVKREDKEAFMAACKAIAVPDKSGTDEVECSLNTWMNAACLEMVKKQDKEAKKNG